MDFHEIDLEKAAGVGIKVNIVHPGTGELFRDDDGKKVTITILGRDSSEWQTASKKIGRKLAARYKKTVPPEAVEESLKEVLSQCTVSWSKNVEWEKAPLKCTKENALMLYKERVWIAEQLLERATDRAEYFLDLGAN